MEYVARLPSASLMLAERAFPTILEGRTAIFSELDQSVYELNESSAALLARLFSPVDLQSFRTDVANSSSYGHLVVENLLFDWSSRGIIDAQVDWDGCAFLPVKYLPTGSGDIAIHFPDDAYGNILSAPYAHLGSHGKPVCQARSVVIGDLAFVQVEGRNTAIVPVSQVGPALHFGLVNALLETQSLVALHAACFVVGEELLLLPASAGSGKSTMAFTLADAGFPCAGDDIVMLDPKTGLAFGIPLPFSFKQASWKWLAQHRPDFQNFPKEERGDGTWVRYIPFSLAALPAWRRVRAIIGLDRGPERTTELTPWSKLECLQRIYGEAHAASGESSAETFRAMTSFVDQAQTNLLRYKESKDVLELMEIHFGF